MFDISEFSELDSTNTYLKRLAEDGEKEGKIIIAFSQTAGRGRMGRSFHSPDGTGLYMSILLRPVYSATEISLITPAAAVAAAEAIEEISGKTAGIKWVNDIFIDSLKVCGILTEASFKGSKADYAIVGAGFNISAPEGGFPRELFKIAGSIFERAPQTDIRKKLALSFSEKLFFYYKNLPERSFLEGYISRSTVLGKEVTVMSEPSYIAKVTEIDRDCRLILEKENGETVRLGAGEISIRPKL